MAYAYNHKLHCIRLHKICSTRGYGATTTNILSLSISLSRLSSVKVHGGIDAYPRDEKAGERRKKALLDHFERAAVLFLVDALKVVGIDVERAGVDEGEGAQRRGAAHGDQTPDDAEENAKYLARVVNHVEKLVLVFPLGRRSPNARPQRRQAGFRWLIARRPRPSAVLHPYVLKLKQVLSITYQVFFNIGLYPIFLGFFLQEVSFVIVLSAKGSIEPNLRIKSISVVER